MLSGILGISLGTNKREKECETKGGGVNQFDLMLTALCFNDRKHCISLHSPRSSLSSTESDIGSDKVEVPPFLPTINRFWKQLAVRAQAKWQASVSVG